jgi:hypothetical protein
VHTLTTARLRPLFDGERRADLRHVEKPEDDIAVGAVRRRPLDVCRARRFKKSASRRSAWRLALPQHSLGLL